MYVSAGRQRDTRNEVMKKKKGRPKYTFDLEQCICSSNEGRKAASCVLGFLPQIQDNHIMCITSLCTCGGFKHFLFETFFTR